MKQDVVTRTVEDERIHVGVLRSMVDETDERQLGQEEQDEDEETGTPEEPDDTNESGLEFHYEWNLH